MGRFNDCFQVDQELRIREFSYGGKTFKVRVPLVSENELMQQRIADAEKNVDAINAIFAKRTLGLEEAEDVVISEDDMVVQGRSMKEAARAEYKAQVQITELFGLLVFENDDGGGPLTYEEIEAELPFTIQIEMMRKIAEAVAPSVDDAKKN